MMVWEFDWNEYRNNTRSLVSETSLKHQSEKEADLGD
jgi:hypothetical protein